ncbi:hypothetical protein GO730_00145 [Spirosoma sp. HMF3257]|uniref:Uncharacterized protein n=1 Tax=Spirosoma telluris TaxID=2183553 RepID=A0A327NKY8_9BACT|nr:hypothetical protein [Spirosoma telluris]RAI73218.1 hypothetical protein HMF3257_00145 [Spirosoma telluris]
MSTLFELFNLLARGVYLLGQKRSAFSITLLAAFFLAILSWYLCNNYVKLWNRRFRLTTTHQVLTLIASTLTFFFVLAFSGLSYMKDVSSAIVSLWEEYEIKEDDKWSNATFKEAFYKIKDLNIENFANIPAPGNQRSFVPVSKKLSQETAAKVYALAACEHFDQAHPFLGKIIWSNPTQSAENISQDVMNFFADNSGSMYSSAKAISIAAETIKIQLNQQTPRTVTLSRIGLIVLYLLVIALPLGFIGYAAYKDIRIQK